jgi:hypothetical protein
MRGRVWGRVKQREFPGKTVEQACIEAPFLGNLADFGGTTTV